MQYYKNKRDRLNRIAQLEVFKKSVYDRKRIFDKDIMKIVLLGLKGVGKTTFGEGLARELGWEFVDTDREMERLFGVRVREMFVDVGEKVFREREHEVLKGINLKGNGVIATGGGSFLLQKNREILQGLGRLVCLYMSKEKLLERWGEWPPFCRSVEEFQRYYDERMAILKELSCMWVHCGE